MKLAATFVALFVIFAGVQADDEFMFFKEIAETCQEKLSASPEILTNFATGKYDDGNASEDAKCFLKCAMDAFDALEGTQQEKFKAMINEEAAKECHDESETDGCEKAYKTYLCMKKNADKVFKAQ